jgi:hypothetical protein
MDLVNWLGCILVVSLGMFFGINFAGKMFDEPFPVADSIPTNPRFLCRRAPFKIGKFAFIITSLVIYVFSLINHDQLAPLLDPIVQQASFLKAIIPKTNDSNLMVAMVAVTIIFIALLRYNFKVNFFYWGRDFIYSCLSIPDTFAKINRQLSHGFSVPSHDRTTLINSSLAIGKNYFDDDVESFDRQWAELAYLDSWIEAQQHVTPDEQIFDGDYLQLSTLNRDFDIFKFSAATRAKDPTAVDETELVKLYEHLRSLKARYAHFVTCMLLVTSPSRAHLYAECRKRKIDIGQPFVGNPFVYSAIYAVTLSVALTITPISCAALYDIWHHPSTGLVDAFSNQKMEILRTWLERGIVNYLIPISVVLLLRNIAWQINPVRIFATIVIYAAVLITAFIISSLGSAAFWLVTHAPSATPETPKGISVFFGNFGADLNALSRALPWSVGPALVSLYINNFLDRQADPTRPNIDSSRSTALRRLASATGFTLFILCLTWPSISQLQSRRSDWSDEKLHFVLASAISIINFSLCFVAQFGLPAPAGSDRPTSIGTAPEHDNGR